MTKHDPVDVLIIGAGASGAAVAWSLADTKMRILCLEQGDWVKPDGLSEQRPATGRRACLRRLRRQAQPPRPRATDYPINNGNSPIKVVNFNGVGGTHRSCTRRTIRACIPRDFRVKTLDGVADDWPIDYARPGAVLRRERPHDGRRRAWRATRPIRPRSRRCRRCRSASTGDMLRRGDEQARLALVAVGHGDRHERL